MLIGKSEVNLMLYLQLKARATVRPGEQLLLRHIADALDSQGEKVMDLPVECAKKEGVWRLPAMAAIKAVLPVCPDVTLLGPSECFVHVLPKEKRNLTRPLRTALAFLVLMVGSAFFSEVVALLMAVWLEVV